MELRRLRATGQEELPRHYEALPLRAGPRLAGWILALAASAWGVWAMVRSPGGWAEAAGAAAAALGGVLIVALLRFRRHELVVGDRWIRLGAGPLVHRIGRRGTRMGPPRPASSWRRLYAAREVELSVPAGGPVLVVPTEDPGELERALEGGAGAGAENAGREPDVDP